MSPQTHGELNDNDFIDSTGFRCKINAKESRSRVTRFKAADAIAYAAYSADRCLSVVRHGVKYAYGLFMSRIGMWGSTFRLVPFSTP